MRRHTSFTAALAMLLLSGSLTTAQAQDIKFVSLTDFASMQHRIDELEGRLASYENLGGSGQKDDVCGSCQKGKGDCGCSGPAWVATYELTIMQPYVSDGFLGRGFDDDYGLGHRFVIGRDGGSGMGVRARYWMYNHRKEGVGGLAGGFVSIDMDVLDLEVTLDEQLHNWDIMVSGGIRYGRSGIDDAGAAFGPFVFEGLGPTFSLEGSRNIGDGGLYVVGNFRASTLFGEVTNFGTLAADDELATVLENQAGIGWRRELASADLNIRALWESQFWLNEAIATATGSNLGFTGPTFSAELRY